MKNRTELVAMVVVDVAHALGHQAVRLLHFLPEDAPDYMSEHYRPAESPSEPPREA